MSVRSVLSPPQDLETPSVERTRVRRRLLGSGSRPWGRLLWAAPALLAGVYLIVLLVDFGPVITSINTFGDAVIAPVLGKLAGQAPANSLIVLGHHPYYEEFLFLRATAGLPFYRSLWNITPLLWTLLGMGILAWSARRALGWVAAVLTTSALICLGALGRFEFFTFNWHGLTVIHTILIGASLVWLAPRAGEISWRRLVIVAVALGLLSALPASSDVLFLIWALVPMAIVAGVLFYLGQGRARWTPAAFTAIVILVAVVLGAVIGDIMRANGITSGAFPVSLASAAGVFHSLPLLGQALLAVGGGDVSAPFHNFVRYPRLVSGILLAAAIVLALFVSARLVVNGTRRLRSRGPVSVPNQVGASGVEERRELAYLTFWSASLVAALLAYVASDVPKLTTASSRYALAGYVAILALFPVMALRGWRWRRWITVGVCVFIVSAIVDLSVRPFVRFGPYPTPALASRVLAFARAHHVDYGYASYWDGPAITWMTDFRLQLYPARAGCLPYVTCPPRLPRISSWYGYRPDTRSLLIADSATNGFRRLDPRLGPPLATGRIGSLALAVYPYDIASELRNLVLPGDYQPSSPDQTISAVANGSAPVR
jgi:hypothetical protein